jgi:hypothetical protein
MHIRQQDELTKDPASHCSNKSDPASARILLCKQETKMNLIASKLLPAAHLAKR